MIFLETDRLLFRSHEFQDEEAFIAMHTDAETRRYVGGRAWPIEEAMRRFRKGYVGRPNETYGMWATIFKENGNYIGCCGLHSTDNGANVSLGCYIARPYWRRGLASEACQAFLDVGFNQLNLPGVAADVEKDHAASERILQKFGFHLVTQEEIPVSGRIICHYELLQSDWKNRRP